MTAYDLIEFLVLIEVILRVFRPLIVTPWVLHPSAKQGRHNLPVTRSVVGNTSGVAS